MATGGRIEFYLLSDELKRLINANAKIMPVTYETISSNLNPNLYEYVRVIDDMDHKNEVYVWDNEVWSLIGADDKLVTWQEIQEKPTTFPPSSHNHDSVYSKIGHTHTEYSPTAHNHDSVYSKLGHTHTEAQITGLDKYTKAQTDALLAEKASLDHNHDGRYYQKSEIESKLAAKANTTHSHSYADLTNKPTIPTATSQLTNDSNYATVTYVDTQIVEAISGGEIDLDGYVTTEAFEGHTGNTTTHVTSTEKATWNAKSSFSGSYMDLRDKPSIPDVSGLATTTALNSHINNTVPHITATERTTWNAKANAADLTSHTGNTTVHVTATERTTWNGKASATDLTNHTGNTTVHITAAERTAWNAKSNFSGSYVDLTNKPTIFSGNYNDLTNKPTIPTTTSQLTNNSGYVTANYVNAELAKVRISVGTTQPTNSSVMWYKEIT